MAIRFVARAELHHLRRFIAGKQADAPQEALHVLDIVLREVSSQRCPTFNSSYLLRSCSLFTFFHQAYLDPS